MSLLWTQYADFLDHLSLLWAIILLPVGLLVLIKGADWLVDGAVAIAKQLGMSPLIIGLTIVAMGTSAPEVAASIEATLNNKPGIALGNVYGSNIANLALVAGLCAIIRPITVPRAALRRDIPIMLAVTLGLYGILYNLQVGYTESALLLALFVGIILFMIYSERKRSQKDTHIAEEQKAVIEHAAPHQPKTGWISSLLILIGLVFLAGGAKITVVSAEVIGIHAGLSETVIGVTIVAVGTSLPELLTCLIAATKGHDDLSVGNLVGSNIFNTLLVIGASGLAKPYSFEHQPELIGGFYWLMIIVLVLFTGIAFAFKKIFKSAGIVLLICYGGYIAYCLNR